MSRPEDQTLRQNPANRIRELKDSPISKVLLEKSKPPPHFRSPADQSFLYALFAFSELPHRCASPRLATIYFLDKEQEIYREGERERESRDDRGAS
jgi:hypothetical protein